MRRFVIAMLLGVLGSAAAGSAEGEALDVTVSRAVLMALEGNRELIVERLGPQIAHTAIGEEKGAFDPVLFADRLGWQEIKGQKLRGGGEVEVFDTSSPVGAIGIGSFLPTGTTIALETSSAVVDETSVNQLVRSRIGLTLSQALLRGFGTDVNLARVRAARIGADLSAYELRGFAESLVAEVEDAYWDCARFRREVEILEQAVALAEQLRRETEERVRIGTLASIEIAAAKSELAFRKQDLIEARADAETARLRLLRLVNPPGPGLWTREVRLQSPLVPADEAIGNVEDHISVALQKRPELNHAKLLVSRGDLEVVRTRNGMLPRMDLFVTLGRSGYAESFGDAWGNRSSQYDDVYAGFNLAFPIGRRTAHARYERATLDRQWSQQVVANLSQLVELDVRAAFVEAARAHEMIAATAETRQLDAEKLDGEWEKHRIGRASTFQVARAQRDLARSRRAEVAAMAKERKALIELARLEGSLLDRRAIGVAGEEFIGGTVGSGSAPPSHP